MLKTRNSLYEMECQIFKRINQHYERRALNLYFRTITNIGGAVAEIFFVLMLLILADGGLHRAAVASAISLTISHILVQLLKKFFPRKRPYLIVAGTKYPVNPLADHSFPSGHTTAVFSVILPLILYMPVLSVLLLPAGFSVAVSRVFLGLHYPSDVLAGICLGSLTGIVSYIEIL